ncbi:MAG: hypothetical protein FWD05_06170 [Oscillospiraceae bacterium]|nr:hypothetical protein [Oscillospiraceae bacterium]
MNQRSKSTLFLIEQLIVVAVFAICATACISIMVAAYFNANESRSISDALLKAESAAEVFKATAGNPNAVADILGGVSNDAYAFPTSDYALVTVYYDSTWQPIHLWDTNTPTPISSPLPPIPDINPNVSYVLTIKFDAPQQTASSFNFIKGQVHIGSSTGEELVRLPLAVRG